MSRTVNEINAQLKANFVGNTTIQTLYGLTPGNTFDQEFSIVSFEATLFYIISMSIWVLELNFDQLEIKINTKIDESRSWNIPNFVADAYAFQYGDALEFINGKYQYPLINEANKIVSVATANETGNSVIIKVAKEVSGSIQEFDISEFDAFSAYINKLKPPGVNLLIVSRPADILKIYGHIYINPLVINTNGELISNPSIKPVEDTINNYCKELDFNGVFDLAELTDLLQSTIGVNTPVIDSASAKFGLTAYAPIIDFYTPNAGYLKIDPSIDLSTTITYLIQ